MNNAERLKRLSELQKGLELAEMRYNINSTEKNNNDLIVIRDEIEIFLKMHKVGKDENN